MSDELTNQSGRTRTARPATRAGTARTRETADATAPVPPADQPQRGRPRSEKARKAILDATAELLLARGLSAVSMDAVAERAGVSKATIYRWWPTKETLALDALYAEWAAAGPAPRDTGTLRGDLLALLTAMSQARATFTAVAAAAGFSGLLADTGLTPAQARDKLLGDQPRWRDQTIYRRAHNRGEIDLECIPPAVLAMPFDLVRHDLLMNLKPLQPKRIHSIVDELFLPLLQSHQSGPVSTRGAVPRPS